MSETIRHPWSPWTPARQLQTVLNGPHGRRFGLLVSTPESPAPEDGWPCLIALDGGRFFSSLSGAVDALSQRSEKTGVTPMVVAAIVHLPEHGPVEDQRALDFTRVAGPEGQGQGGGAGEFTRFLIDQALPAIREAAPTNAGRLSLFGHSLAGLFVLDLLAATPDAFARWIAVSPSLWWSEPPVTTASALMVGCGELETAREMRGRIDQWVEAAGQGAGRPVYRLAPGADHGSAPFALIPDILRHASGA